MSTDSTPPPSPVPPRPWKKGDQGAYSMVVLELEVCKDEFGRVFTGHHPQDESDEKLLSTWPAGGQEMVAFALLTEAVRREALFGLLIEMSKNKDTLDKVKDPEERAKIVQALTERLQVQTERTVKRLAEAAVNEALQFAESR
jgi:hypothetical protein